MSYMSNMNILVFALTCKFIMCYGFDNDGNDIKL